MLKGRQFCIFDSSQQLFSPNKNYMKNSMRFLASALLICSFFYNALPCGPAYIAPVFDYKHAPENPFENFAAGKVGIVKPTYHRSVLIAAYRYLNGGSFSADEQKGLVDVWKAEFSNESYQSEDVNEAVKKWVEKRKSVVGKEEKTPQIYVEREYGGYEFFPNCTVSAFDTATQTLSSRISSYGSEDKDVKEWVSAQDKVFTNCASGRQIPEEANSSMSEWLQKDRAYQVAAAEFYSLNYDSAKTRFAEIAVDSNSPWQQTADYLVARTMIRQASLSKSPEKANDIYSEVQTKLETLISSGNKFADSAEKLLGLVKYRIKPQERVRELGQKIAYQSGNQNFRQDLIDYTWLLDKFEKEALEAEEKRKAADKPVDPNSENANTSSEINNANTVSTEKKQKDDDLSIYLYSDDYQQNWTFYVRGDATDEEALKEAERVVGRPLSDEMKKRIKESRQTAYQNRFSDNRQAEYQGGYYGEEEASLSLLPAFLRYEELTDWLFTFQISNNEAYLYSLTKYRSTTSDLWLMTALSKAESTSSEINSLLETANKTSRTSLAFPTIAFHTARIYISQGKNAEAKKLIDEMLNSTEILPISTINQFMDLRLKLAETLEDFLKFSLKKPFAFDLDGASGTIQQFIDEQKSWYDPKTAENSREEHDLEVEERFKNEKLWENRLFLDSDTFNAINHHFPLASLIELEKSPSLPEYMRESVAMSIWTKAIILEDYAVAKKIEPAFLKYHPEMESQINQINAAATPREKQDLILYFILKNPILTPYLESPFDRTDNETGQFDTNDWWCVPYESEDSEEVKSSMPAKPVFITSSQSLAAQAERKKIKALGDAPQFLGEKVLAWAKRAPTDKRVPESLFIVFEANGWKKYSCGNNIELQEQIGTLLKTRYPKSEWTKKMETEAQQ